MRARIEPQKFEELEQDLMFYFGVDELDLVKKAAQSTSNVLLLGKQGSALRVAAEAIHYLSKRRTHPFVVIQCEDGSPDLQEEALFGPRESIGQSSLTQEAGLLQRANHGTAFLTEVAQLPLSTQALLMDKLSLTAALEKASSTHKADQVIDVRLIAGTEKNVELEMEKQTLRADLFHWISELHIRLKPLNERKYDISYLAEHFMRYAARRQNKSLLGFTQQAKYCLKSFEWDADIAQLEAAVEYAVIASKKKFIDVEDLPAYVTKREESIFGNAAQDGNNRGKRTTLQDAVEDFQRKYIKSTLEECGWDKDWAATELGLPLSTLERKLMQFGLREPDRRTRNAP